MTATEETPLLGHSEASARAIAVVDNERNSSSSIDDLDIGDIAKLAEQHNVIYDRFSQGQKIVILGLISFCGLLPLFVSGSFFPSLPIIAKELNTTNAAIGITVSVSFSAAGIGGLCGASYSSFYGRRIIYLFGLPLLIIGSIGVAFSHTVLQLLVWRFIQTFGGSPALSVGAGVIGDIYKLEERGTAMGIFFGACLLGPALAPFVGGVVAHYTSWRFMQLCLSGWGLLAFISIVLFCPETSIPGSRGIDKRREETGEERISFVWINPLRALLLLRSPNLLLVSLAGSAILLTDFVLLIPLSFTIGARYGISNPAALGMCYIPIGLGNFIGAPVAGWVSDKIVARMKKQRGGVWYPEDRLRGTLIGAATFAPLSVLGIGLLTQYVPGRLGLILNLVCLFFNGLGVDLVLSPSAAYVVDVVHSRSAESMAANNGLRSFLVSLTTAAILPMINHIGVAGTNAVSALIAWLGFGLLWVTIKYGERLRASVDVGYSTALTN